MDVKPSLLHGDLWSGNVAETHEGPGNLTISNNDHSLFFPNRQGEERGNFLCVQHCFDKQIAIRIILISFDCDHGPTIILNNNYPLSLNGL